MAAKSLLSIIFVVAFVSLSLAQPVDPASESRNILVKNDDGEEFSLNPQEYLVYYTVLNFQDMSQEYVDRAASISTQLLSDKVLQSATDSTVKEFNKNITEFMEQYKTLDNLEELFNLVDLYSDTTSYYYELAPESATQEMLTIEQKLKEYNSDDSDKKFEEDFENFVLQFLAEFQEFKLKLIPAELDQFKGLIEWSQKLKQLPSTEDKISAFGEFFKFFEEK